MRYATQAGLSFDDLSRFQIQHRRSGVGGRRIETPPWALRPELTRMLLVRYLERRVGLRYPQPGTERERLDRAEQQLLKRVPFLQATLKGLCERLVAGPPYHQSDGKFISRRVLEAEVLNADAQLRIAQRGMAGTILRAIHLYYGAALDSVAVGNELGMRPPACRQLLFRLHATWKMMSAEAGDPAAWAGRNKALRWAVGPEAQPGATKYTGSNLQRNPGPCAPETTSAHVCRG